MLPTHLSGRAHLSPTGVSSPPQQPVPSEDIERALGFSGTFSITILRKYLKLKNTVILIFRLPRVIPDSTVWSLSSRSFRGQPVDSFWEYRCMWEEENLKLIEHLPCIWLRICVLYITTYSNLTANMNAQPHVTEKDTEADSVMNS